MMKVEDFKAQYNCRFHPINFWHEVGCGHQTWTTKQLQKALDNAKQSNEYLNYLYGEREI